MKLTLYMRPLCPPCTYTKEYLKNQQIEFTEVDITENKKAIEILRYHGYQSVPVVSINDFEESWSGYDLNKLKRLKS